MSKEMYGIFRKHAANLVELSLNETAKDKSTWRVHTSAKANVVQIWSPDS